MDMDTECILSPCLYPHGDLWLTSWLKDIILYNLNLLNYCINIAKLIIHTFYSSFTANIISQQTFNHKKKFSDNVLR